MGSRYLILLAQPRGHGIIFLLLRRSSRFGCKLTILLLRGLSAHNCECRVQHMQVLVALPIGVDCADWGACPPRVLGSILLVHRVEDSVSTLYHEPGLSRLSAAVLAQLIVIALWPLTDLRVGRPLRGQS